MNPIPVSTITGLIISLVVCFALPVGGYIWSRKSFGKITKPFIFGMLAFFVSQILLRIPALQYLMPQFSWYTAFAVGHPYLYGFFLAFTAGVFEEAARYLAVRFFLKKNRGFGDGIAFGFGHGGIEAILITGLSLINFTIYSFAINNGTFQSLLAAATEAQRDYISATLYNLSFMDALLGGVERVFAVAAHVGLTIIVFRGFSVGKPGRYLVYAIAAHAALDFAAVALQQAGAGSYLIEAVVAAFAIASVIYIIWAKRHTPWPEKVEEE
ncbi:MAG: YhfC family intramembrane metalloprotease [Clostridia bacterium]|nr:YhfC family intramembrane metalloprotease [Clostridia bacterium]